MVQQNRELFIIGKKAIKPSRQFFSSVDVSSLVLDPVSFKRPNEGKT